MNIDHGDLDVRVAHRLCRHRLFRPGCERRVWHKCA